MKMKQVSEAKEMGEAPFVCNKSLDDFEKKHTPRIGDHLLVKLLKKSPSCFYSLVYLALPTLMLSTP